MKNFFLVTSLVFIFIIGLILVLGKTKITFNQPDHQEAYTESDFIKNYYNSEQLLLINVWATWCAPCIAEIPTLEKIAKHHKNVKLVSISIDEDTLKLRKFLQKRPNLKMNDITFKNLQHRDSIYQTIKLINPIVSTAIIKFDSKKIPYLVLVRKKKILYQAYDDLNIAILERIILANP